MNRKNFSAAHADVGWDLKEGRVMDASCEARLVGFRLPVVVSLGAWEECVWDPNYSLDAEQAQTVRLVGHLCEAMGLSPVPPRVVTFGVTREARGAARRVELEAECAPDVSGRPFVLVRLTDEGEWESREF